MPRPVPMTLLVLGLLALGASPSPAQALPDRLIAGSPASAKAVPLMDGAELHEREAIHFRRCADLPTEPAVRAWEQGFPQVAVDVTPASCSEADRQPGELGRRNGTDEIYVGKTGTGRIGTYVRWSDGNAIVEEDIVVDRSRVTARARAEGFDRRTAMVNLLIHELGHAFGLSDVYDDHPGECGWSVMLSVCADRVIPPQPADIEALRRLHDIPRRTLTDFDADGDGRLDDGEFFILIDAWVADRVSDELLYKGLDAWVNNASIAKQGLRRDLAEAHWIEVYALDGDRVARFEGLDAFNRWRRRTPPGTYLYRAFDGSKRWTSTVAIH